MLLKESLRAREGTAEVRVCGTFALGLAAGILTVGAGRAHDLGVRNEVYRERMAGVLRDEPLRRGIQASLDAYEPVPLGLVSLSRKPWRTRVLKFPITVWRFERVFEAQGEPCVARWVLAVRLAWPTVRS